MRLPWFLLLLVACGSSEPQILEFKLSSDLVWPFEELTIDLVVEDKEGELSGGTLFLVVEGAANRWDRNFLLVDQVPAEATEAALTLGLSFGSGAATGNYSVEVAIEDGGGARSAPAGAIVTLLSNQN